MTSNSTACIFFSDKIPEGILTLDDLQAETSKKEQIVIIKRKEYFFDMSLTDNYKQVLQSISDAKVTLVVVSKTQSVEKIQEIYNSGHRDFGENKVQELIVKAELLPSDMRWHLIGHLQSNKVKYIAGFVHLIHSVDSLNLLKEINKQGEKNNRIIDCLLQVYIAKEETKFGLDPEELTALLNNPLYMQMNQIRIRGLMGMATNIENQPQIRSEFRNLKEIFEHVKANVFLGDPNFNILSMGMSGDYKIAIEEGSTLVRVGSAIFGER
jgi:PLP dependent protein